jgi:hypothetical protein
VLAAEGVEWAEGIREGVRAGAGAGARGGVRVGALAIKVDAGDFECGSILACLRCGVGVTFSFFGSCFDFNVTLPIQSNIRQNAFFRKLPYFSPSFYDVHVEKSE